MKKLNQILILISAVTALQSCNNSTNKTDSKATADTLNNMKGAVADSSKSITKDLVMKVSKDDARFAVAAADGGMAEVELGKLAGTNGQDPGVKYFGDMMIKDHSAANSKLITIAKSKGISLPDKLSEFEQKMKDKFAAKTGHDFDKAYVDDMIKDHQKDIQEFTGAINTLKDPELKAFASETLPTLKLHLAAILKVKQELKQHK